MADDTIVTEWRVDAEQAMAALERIADSAEGAGKRVEKGMAAAHVAGNLATAAINKMGDAMKKAARQALEWSEDMPADMTQVNALSRAVGGLVDKLTLAQTVEKMQLENMRLSQGEMEAVSKAAVKLSRVWNVDFATAMDTVTQKLVGGKGLTKLLNQLGLEGKGIAQLKDPVGGALALISKGFGDVSIKAENAKERVVKMRSALSDSVGEFGKAVVESEFFTKRLGMLSEAFNLLAGLIKVATGQLSIFSNQGRIAMESVTAFLRLTNLGVAISPQAYGGKNTEAVARMLENLLKEGSKLERPSGWEYGPTMGELTAGRGKLGGGGPKSGKKVKHGYEKGIDYFPGQEVPKEWQESLTAEGMQKEFEEKWKWEELAIERASKAALAYKEIQREIFGPRDAEIRAIDKQTQAYLSQQHAIKGLGKEMANMAAGALADFAGGIWAVADAALMGGESFGAAMAQMVKATLLGIAQQATVKAIFNVAEGLMCLAGFASSFGTAVPLSVAAGLHFKAAAMYGAIALGTGAAGLGMSAAGVGAASGEKKREESRKQDSYSPSVGQTIKEDQRPLYINVYFGDPTDPAAALLASKQIEIGLRRGGAIARAAA